MKKRRYEQQKITEQDDREFVERPSIQLHSDEGSEEANDKMSPAQFGTHAHSAYEITAYQHFEDVDLERIVSVEEEGGLFKDGRIDLIVDENKLLDFKTGDMRKWDEARARREAEVDGLQMYGYINSPDTPDDSIGTIVRTVPSESEDVLNAYREGLAEYGVATIFCESESPDAVVAAIEQKIIELEGEKEEEVEDDAEGI